MGAQPQIQRDVELTSRIGAEVHIAVALDALSGETKHSIEAA